LHLSSFHLSEQKEKGPYKQTRSSDAKKKKVVATRSSKARPLQQFDYSPACGDNDDSSYEVHLNGDGEDMSDECVSRDGEDMDKKSS